MSMMYCENCGGLIDTDYNAEHFEECGDAFEEAQQELKQEWEQCEADKAQDKQS